MIVAAVCQFVYGAAGVGLFTLTYRVIPLAEIEKTREIVNRI
jgi:hypothetical protein